ncbi:hypothetical protein RDE2_47500 [Rhodococcus sp. RDE2]|nr:hypothetical protein RDE2_47500 [Rhodococcus sp. RDE2]
MSTRSLPVSRGFAISSANIRPATRAISISTSGATPATVNNTHRGTTVDNGPVTAIDTGMRASETKKSRLATRPIMPSGTRLCSRVPHRTMPAASANPMTNVATIMTVNDVVKAKTANGRVPTPQHISMTVR